jgi:hypothetical protein
MRSVLVGDKSTTKEIKKPGPDSDRWQEKLTCRGHQKNPGTTKDGEELHSRRRRGDPEREENEKSYNGVLEI